MQLLFDLAVLVLGISSEYVSVMTSRVKERKVTGKKKSPFSMLLLILERGRNTEVSMNMVVILICLKGKGQTTH